MDGRPRVARRSGCYGATGDASWIGDWKSNRNNWNERRPVHAASDFYDVEGFKAGQMTLTDIERREVGDVSGKTLLHLQCHFGQDTMSWSRLGAMATGVDFSDAAIELARSLNDELGLDGSIRLLQSIYDLPDTLDERIRHRVHVVWRFDLATGSG